MKGFLLRGIFIVVLNWPFFLCHSQIVQKEKSLNIAPTTSNKSIRKDYIGQGDHNLDSLIIKLFFRSYPLLKNVEQEVITFYRSRDFSFAWYSEGKIIEQAYNLHNRISNLGDEGISQKVPYQNALDSFIYRAESFPAEKPNSALEIMLTAQYFIFSKLSWEGMDQSVSESLKWYLPRKKVQYEEYLDTLLSSKDPNELIKEPVYRQYNLLKGFLKKYKDLALQETWPILNQTSISSQQGDSSLFIAQVKKRLFLFEDYQGDTTTTLFDKNLYESTRQFQKRNGLKIDGKIGRETCNALNIPLKSRIRQILVNMERNRWLPIASNEDVLAVNIPDFKLHVFHKDSLLWSCNVVVGQTIHPTTIFYGDLESVVFSPYWNVPESIVQQEIVPQMKKNPNYLTEHYMEIRGYRNDLPIVRQKPGSNNALGLVKFLFPNSYNIYLHDTPSKSLFGESARAFSHGCIRVEEPVKLASFLLRFQTQWTLKKIDAAMHSGKETSVKLRKTVPVFIVYFTAFVDKSQKLNFRKDIYYLDDRLAEMILEDK
ncbi:murein L,D-transpeptidase YcbB/YkuD [Pedobacter sp. UYEF25]